MLSGWSIILVLVKPLYQFVRPGVQGRYCVNWSSSKGTLSNRIKGFLSSATKRHFWASTFVFTKPLATSSPLSLTSEPVRKADTFVSFRLAAGSGGGSLLRL